MGNVLEQPKTSGDALTDDLKWLAVQNSSLFNDAYVSEVYESLPAFTGTDLPVSDNEGQNHSDRSGGILVERLVQIFTASQKGATTVENFERLSSENELEMSPFALSNKRRSRLMQRIHLAMLRTSAKSDSNSDDSMVDRFVDVVDNDLFKDPDGLLTATSIRMSLSIMKCLTPSHPELFRTMADSIMDLLQKSTNLALASVETSSPQAEALRAIIEFAESIASERSANRSSAIALMLAVAVKSGSLSGILAVVSQLRNGTDRIAETASSFMHVLQTTETILNLSLPTSDAMSNQVDVKIAFEVPSGCKSESSITTDGQYLYIWNGLTCSIHKVGTGFHGTISGNEYISNTAVEDQLRENLGTRVYVAREKDVSGTPPASSSGAAANGETVRSIRVTSCTRQIVVEAGMDPQEVLSGRAEPEDVIDTEQGYTAPILEERTVNLEDFEGRAVRFFRIDERTWIGEEEPDEESEDEEELDEDDEDDEEIQITPFTTHVEVISTMATAGGVEVQGNIGCDDDDAVQQAWVAYANGKIYLRMKNLIGPFRIAVFSASALKLEDVVDLNLPIPKLAKAKRQWHKKLARRMTENAMEEWEETKDDVVRYDEKEIEPIDAMEVEVTLEDHDEDSDDEVEEFEDGEEVDILHSVLIGNEDAPPPSVVAASSNFMISGGAQERNLLAPPESVNSDLYFQFGEGDSNQELILDLGTQFTVYQIGAMFEHTDAAFNVRDRFTAYTSQDGTSYTEFATATSLSQDTVMLRLPSTQEGYDGPPTPALNVRYIRYEFGECALSGSGSVIKSLFVTGPKRVRKKESVPFPVMTSNGRHLIFLYATHKDGDSTDRKDLDGETDQEDISEPIVKSFVIDPWLGLKSDFTEKEFAWGLPGGETELQNCSFLYNGASMIVSYCKKVASDDKSATLLFWKLDCHGGKLISTSEHKYEKSNSKSFPLAFCYDSRNNMSWGWNWYDISCPVWRNDGLAPRFDPPRPKAWKNMLLSTSPNFRLEALNSMDENKRDASHDAAIILNHLDRLSRLFSPPIVAAADANKLNEIEVVAAGVEDGNYCQLLVRGQSCGSCNRGFNILVLDKNLCPKDFRNFDTHQATTASDRMADFIESIPEKTVVLVGTVDSFQTNLTSRGRSALRSLGASSHVEKLPDKGAFALIGRRGGEGREVVQQVMERKNGPASVRFRIPSPKVSLCIESSQPAIHALVDIICADYVRFRDGTASDMGIVMLITTMRLLSTNIHQLLCGTPIDKATQVFEQSDRTRIIEVLNEIIDHPLDDIEGGAVVAQTALELFVTSIDVLYPTPTERCALLVKYLEQFVEETLSDLEGSVLELLLRRMASPRSLAKLFEHAESADVGSPIHLLLSLLSIARKETTLRLQRLADSAVSKQVTSPLSVTPASSKAGVGDAAVQMLASLSNMILSQSAQAIVTKDGADVNKPAEAIISLITHISECSSAILECAASVNKQLFDCRIADKTIVLDDEIDEIVKVSPVGELLTTVLYASASIFEAHGAKMTPFFTDTLSQSLTTCLQSVQTVLNTLPKNKLQSGGGGEAGPKFVTEVYESLHPYLANTDEKFEINFPKALKLTISFSDETRAENNYDYVRIWKDSSKSESCHPGIDKLTGRNGSENWPGQRGRPPLEIDGGQCYVEWKTDGSNEDWGWKFECVVEYKRVISSQSHWLVDLEKQLGYCGSVAAVSMIVSVPWNKEIEDRNAIWMEDSLLNFGFMEEGETEAAVDCIETNTEELLFLREFVDRVPGSLAAALCAKMKKFVIEDKGQVEDINRAVYATCAALLKHNNVVTEALALAKGDNTKPSEVLIKVWKAGQNMHKFFQFGDVKFATEADAADVDLDMPPPPTLERGPSIYSGADVDVIHRTSEAVITRAQFLLRVNSSSKAAAVAKETAKRKWALLSKTVIHRGKSTEKDGAGGGEKWHALVGEVQAAYQLKGMLSHRRREAALRKERAGDLTTSEKVLRFVQGSVKVEDLESIRSLRNSRANVRAIGLSMMSQLVSSAVSPFTIRWLMSCFAHAIGKTKRPESVHSHVHYLNCIEGCSSGERGLVIKSFCSMVEKCVTLMAKTYGNSLMEGIKESEKKDWESVTISCIRALAIDYDLLDHSILDSSNILSELQFFLRSDSMEVQRTGWALFELLLPRCIGLDQHKMGPIASEPSEFSKKIVALLVSQLDRAASRVSSPDAAKVLSPMDDLLNGVKIVPGKVVLRRDALGYTMPHVPLGLYHTFTFWMKRKKCPNDDAMASRDITDGHRVMRGPNWPKTSVEDGCKGGFGTVTKVTNGSVSVKWDNGNTGTYKYGNVEDGKEIYEISIVDETVGGHLFSKGMTALMDGDNAPVWSTFGLSLAPTAKLQMFAYSGGGEFVTSVGSSIIWHEWTHVAVVQEREMSKIYINGVLDTENTLPSYMLYPGQGGKDEIIVESSHPYADNTDQYTVIQEEGAISYTITFDPQTRTESNYDYLRFYKDDSHTDYWGAEKYTGGRGGSSMNWPGFGGRQSLVIPAHRFVIWFKTDNSNTDWGYKMTIAVEKLTAIDDSKPIIEMLNDKPIYLGQMPTYVNNFPTLPNAVDCSIANLSVFSRSLSGNEIASLAANKPRDTGTGGGDEILCLDVISMMQRSSKALQHIAVQLNSAFSGPSVLYPLLCIAMNGTAYVQSSALRVCASLLPVCPVDVVNVQARRVVNMGENEFVHYLFNRVGQVMNVWARYSADQVPVARMCNELEVSIGMELLKLLNALAESDIWGPSVLDVAKHIITEKAGSVIGKLQALSEEETARGKSFRNVGVPESDINVLNAILGLLGGSVKGLFTGASARYAAGDDNGIMEDCTVLAPTWPPDLSSVTDKDELALWKDLTSFGDAFVIVMHSQPGIAAVVPRSKLKVTATPFSKDMDNFLAQLSESLVEMFAMLAKIDPSDRRPVHKPRVVETDVEKVFESKHPYADSLDEFEEICFEGAKSIEIEFDRRTRTEPNCDYVRFYKDNSRRAYYGEEKYHGRDSNQNWPGLGGKPNLIIPAESFVLHFHSDSSNNDWGYQFTARAHCRIVTYPPARPPLLHNSILGHIKLLGLTAFKTLLQEFTWMTIDAMPVIPDLLTAALSSVPVTKLGPITSKPIILESKHPYDHNAEDYYPIRIPGAKKIVVTFDEQTCCESGCDYMKFYKDDSKTEFWGDSQYTGGKDGGSCNWPGIKGRPPLIIPASSFVVYWHTDSSVNTWGWKMVVKASDANEGDGIPEMNSSLCSYRAECCQMVLRDCPLRVPEPDLDGFDTEPYTAAVDGLVLDISDDLTPEALAASSLDLADAPVLTPLDKKKSNVHAMEEAQAQTVSRSRWPRNFKLNCNDAQEFVMRAEPSDDSVVLLTLGADAVVSAEGEQGDWLRCTSNTTTGWVRRKNHDMQYVIPMSSDPAVVSAATATEDDLVTLPDEDDASSSAISTNRHPMYDVDESSLASVYGKSDIQPTPLDTLLACSTAIERTAADMTQIASICIAQDCLSRIISLWPNDIPFGMSSFGSGGRLLAYIRAAFIRETTDDKPANTPALTALKNRILDVIRKEDKEDAVGGSDDTMQLSDVIMTFAVKQLTDSLHVENALTPTRAKVKTLESIHPYEDNMAELYELSIPGAKKLKIVFDPRTSTERGCDYLVIYKDSSKTQSFGPQYTGRASGSDKVWAGLGNVPACEVPGDSCCVYFHSDSSNVDWGFALTCYGIMEEPSDEEREKLAAQKSSPNKSSPKLACWLLEFLAKEHVAGVYRNLYAPSTIATLRRYVEIMPPDKKLFALNLLTSMIQELTKVPLSREAVNEVMLLKGVIVDLSTKQHRDELAASGGRAEDTSQLLQALVQATIVLDSGLASLSLDDKRGLLSPKKQKSRGIVVMEEPVATGAGDGEILLVGWASAPLGTHLELANKKQTVRKTLTTTTSKYTSALSCVGYTKECIACHVRINHLSGDGPSIGAAVADIQIDTQLGTTAVDFFSVGWNAGVLRVSGEAEAIPFGPLCKVDDVVTVTIDIAKKTISYHRNHAFIGVAVGPPGSGAIVERDIGSDAIHLAVSLCNADDAVTVLGSVPPPLAPVTSITALAVKASSEVPDWFAPIREAVTLLRSASARELPASVFSKEFIPMCEKNHEVVIESAHPFDGESWKRSVRIPGADSLTVRFDGATSMGTRDTIRICGSAESDRFEFCGMKGGTVVSQPSPHTITMHDKVVRGPNWDWGDQDGGAGSYGEVIEVTTWKGKSNAGVTVRWLDNDFQGLYRWDFEGLFDLLVVGQSEKSSKPIILSGDSLDLEVIGDPESTNSSNTLDWSGALLFNGTSAYLELPPSDNIEMTGDLTVELWIKVAAGVASTIDYMPLFSRQIELDGRMTQFGLQLGYPNEADTTKLVLHCINQEMGVAVHVVGGNIVPGKWTHVAATITGNASALLVNGTVVGTAGSMSSVRLGSLGAPLLVGKSEDSRYFAGHMFDIRIWTIGRGIESINQAKNSIPTNTPTGLVSLLGTMASPIADIIFDAVDTTAPVGAVDVTWDTAVDPNVMPSDVIYGFKCTVRPKFSLHTVMRSEQFQATLLELQNQYTVGEFRHDVALVRYINQVSRTKKISVDQLLVCKWSDLAPCEEDLVTMPVLKELLDLTPIESTSGGEEESKSSNSAREAKSTDDTEEKTMKPKLKPVEARLKLLQLLNKALASTVAYIDLCAMDKPWSIASLLTACRGLIFEGTKMPIWTRAMAATNVSSSQFELRVSRSRASKFSRTRQVDDEARWMIFSQIFRVLHIMPPRSLRRTDKLFNVMFMGERAHDAGGPYRECYAMMALELQSHSLPLLLRVPNNRGAIGVNREKWVFNPGATSSLHMDMFCFLGKLMGIAVRTKEYLALDIAPIIWKLLVNETPTREDFEGIDLFQVKSLQKMRDIHLDGIDETNFNYTFFETFTTESTDKRTIELVPGGAEKDVTFENRHYYCDLVEQYRLHEFDQQAAAVRRGLAAMLPYRLLSLFTWDQLEEFVCGRAVIDVSLLKSVTEYSSCSASDEHIRFFWQAMEDFSNEERSVFIRFAWGRSRLPLTAEAFPQRFKLQSFGKSPPDSYLPVAHTCFFSLELPRYSSLEIMKEKLLYAIFNCQAIDGDDTSVGMNAASMGWEE